MLILREEIRLVIVLAPFCGASIRCHLDLLSFWDL